jgi:photosystem II stability/assembly factor-like uncharacterized protein
MRVQIFVILLLLQSIVSCQQPQDPFNPLTASLIPKETKQVKQENAKDGIFYQSSDGGQNWQDISTSMPPSSRGGGLYAEGEQLYISSDRGLMYSRTASPVRIWEKALLPNEGIGSVFPGKKGSYAISYNNTVFQNIPGTSVWNPVFKDMRINMVFSLHELKEGHIVAACNKGIFLTTDGGNSWQHVFTDGTVWKMTYTDGVLLAANEKGLLRSTDDGKTWDFVLKGKGGTQDVCVLSDRLVHLSGNLKPWKEDMEPDDFKNQLHISKDKGKTWEMADFGLFDYSSVYNSEKRPQIRFVYDMAQVGQYLLCSCDSGVFRSPDNGKTWELLFPVTDKVMYGLTVSGKVIYIMKDRSLGGC